MEHSAAKRIGLFRHRRGSVSTSDLVSEQPKHPLVKPLHESAAMLRPTGPPIVLGPICKVRVLTNVRVKMPGFLQVSEGEQLTLLHAENLDSSLCLCRRGDEEGRLPVGAVYISQHCWNPYLQLMGVIVTSCPRPLWMMLKQETVKEIVDLFSADGLLQRMVDCLCRYECDDKKARHLETEIFRAESPSVLVLNHLLQHKAELEFREQFVKFVHSRVLEVEASWSMQKLCDVLAQTFKQLQAMVHVAPPLFALAVSVLRGLGKDWTSLAASFIFLRFFCPGLAQIGVNSSAMMDVAKALQLVANRVTPSADSAFFSVKDQLVAMFDEPARLLKQAPATNSVFDVDEDLHEAGRRFYDRLLKMQLTPDESSAFEPVFSLLGAPFAPPAALLEWENITKERIIYFLVNKQA